MRSEPLRARLHEAGLQLVTSLTAHRPENVQWLFKEEGLADLFSWLLQQYEVFDVRL
jgi:hypothetical protein